MNDVIFPKQRKSFSWAEWQNLEQMTAFISYKKKNKQLNDLNGQQLDSTAILILFFSQHSS